MGDEVPVNCIFSTIREAVSPPESQLRYLVVSHNKMSRQAINTSQSLFDGSRRTKQETTEVCTVAV
jgi:hypothetical protein